MLVYALTAWPFWSYFTRFDTPSRPCASGESRQLIKSKLMCVYLATFVGSSCSIFHFSGGGTTAAFSVNFGDDNKTMLVAFRLLMRRVVGVRPSYTRQTRHCVQMR